MTRLLFKTALLLLLAWVAAGLYLSDRFLFERTEELLIHYRDKLGEEIKERHPIAFLMTFDEPIVREWISGGDVIASGVDSVPARYGRGRQFTGTLSSIIHTPINWRHIAPAHSISMWIKLLPPSGDQDIMFSYYQQRHVGLRLMDGNMTFLIPAPAYIQSIAYPFTRWDEFVHIAAVASPEEGVARLYENGRLMAEGPIDTVDFPSHNIEFGTRRWYATRDPLHAVLDETAIWNKPLTEKEIRRIYRSRRSLLADLSPSYYRKWRGATQMEEGLKKAVKYIDLFNPRLHQGRILAADIPEIHLVLRNRHLRHFNRAHVQSLRSGRRTAEAADFKPIEFVFEGAAARGELALDGSDLWYGQSIRRSFLLDVPHAPIRGMHSVRLLPPEALDVLVPLLDTRVAQHLNLPHTQNGLCRLFINGEFVGVYYYEDDTHRSVAPHASLDFVRAPSSTTDWPSLFRRPTPFLEAPRGPPRNQAPVSRDTLVELYEDVVRETLPLLINDGHSPTSSREIDYRTHKRRDPILALWSPAQDGSTAEQVAAYLTPFMLLGNNPSPSYIREDLSLNVFPQAQATIEWRSSDPGLLSSDGHVTPPDGDVPEGVTMTAVVSDQNTVVERAFDFRVMPEHPRLDAYMLYVGDTLQKNRRVDGRLELYQGRHHQPERYRLFHGRRAGVKYRGNHGFWQTGHRRAPFFARRKLALSLRFENAHGLLNETATRHAYFATGYIDTTLMRNALSYNLYKKLGTDEAPRPAADVTWAELFINGHYRGVYEFNSRIDRHKLGMDRVNPDFDHPAVLYKFEAAARNFGRPNTGAITQKEPPRFYGAYWDPYLELVDMVRTPDPSDFVAGVEERVDVDSVMDHHLLLNLTDNRDGIAWNLYVARHAGPDARVWIVPWDYDKTFRANRNPRWLSNALTTRLVKDHPDYVTRLSERWNSLREHEFSDQAVLSMIEDMERHLDGYIQWDYLLWDNLYSDGVPFEEQTHALREAALKQMAYLDAHIPTLLEDEDQDESPDEVESERAND